MVFLYIHQMEYHNPNTSKFQKVLIKSATVMHAARISYLNMTHL